MRGIPAKLAALAVLAIIPAVALAASTTYKGNGTYDQRAKIELVVAKHGDERVVKRITVNRLRYRNGEFNCSDSGRTGRLTIRGSWEVNARRNFRARDQVRSGLGELSMTGGINQGHVEGIARFVFGKDGCKTERTHFTARP